MAASSRSIDQRHLADLLGLADLRVRRLIREYIAPASRAGGFKTAGAFDEDAFFVGPHPDIAFLALVDSDRTRAIELMSAALGPQDADPAVRPAGKGRRVGHL